MDTSRLAFPKGRPRALDKAVRRKALEARDKRESDKARTRAAGRCEIEVVGQGRCLRRDTETHHMVGGWGKRARGTSYLADRKQRVCVVHHGQITARLLRRIGSDVPHYTDTYERLK